MRRNWIGWLDPKNVAPLRCLIPPSRGVERRRRLPFCQMFAGTSTFALRPRQYRWKILESSVTTAQIPPCYFPGSRGTTTETRAFVKKRQRERGREGRTREPAVAPQALLATLPAAAEEEGGDGRVAGLKTPAGRAAVGWGRKKRKRFNRVCRSSASRLPPGPLSVRQFCVLHK